MSHPPPLLEAKALSKHFHKTTSTPLFDKVNLTLSQGESVAIVGPSGCGKTTLLHTLATLETPSNGTLYFEGKPFASYKQTLLRNQKMGFVFQNFNLIESLSVLENVLVPACIKGSQQEALVRAKHLLTHLGLGKAYDRPAHHLSGGEKQRVAIARALINDPPLILADEPTGNLDETSAHNLFNLLLEQTKKYNKALLLVTHSRELALLCDTLYTLNDQGLRKLTKE